MKPYLVESATHKTISLPFNGLYHSYLGEQLDYELEYYTDDMSDIKVDELSDFICSLNLNGYHDALTKDYANFLIDILNDYHDLNIKIKNVTYETMNGRNTGDNLWCDIDVTTLPYIELDKLQTYATDSLTSRSGFISFYNPDLKPLQDAKIQNWNDVYVTFIIEYLANDCNDIEHQYIESLTSNGGTIEMLYSVLSDKDIDKLNKLLEE